MMRLPSHPFIAYVCSFSLSCIDVSATLVSTFCPNYLMILVSFSIGALMTFVMLVS
jgi:hypothetical protein